MADPRQTFLTEPFDTWYGCPDHPRWGMTAIVQRTHHAPVTITRNSDGQFEIEQSPMAEFVHEMASEVTVAYRCSSPECAFAIAPDDLSALVERHHERQL